MNENVIVLNIFQFGLIYLLLLITLAVMKKCKIKQTKLLVLASIRMTVQLTLAGYILTYIFENPHPLFTAGYLALMLAFAAYTVLKRIKELNKNFKVIVAISQTLSGLFIVSFFIIVVVGADIFDPQYTIPISGMIVGNSMTSVTLGLKSFVDNLKNNRNRVDTFLNLGVKPQKILNPFVNNSIEMALIPTLNSMISMGIISLPGMMTGQILSGTLPTTAIMYQIAIMIAISTAGCLTSFFSIYLGSRTLYNNQNQIIFYTD